MTHRPCTNTEPTRLAEALREIERLRGVLKVIAVWASVNAKDNEENPILSREFSDIEDKAMAALRGEEEK